ncbi:MAG: hypothetical protein KDB14_01985, partial [Planctomycetales bacterium]|nr:hypothetical protein [Planctomycetales bacterium]
MAFIARAANQALAHNAQWYAAQVREYWQRRELHAALARGVYRLTQGKANAAEVAELVESQLQAAQHETGADVQTLEGMLSDAIGNVRDAKQRGLTLGLSTGLEILDRETGGFFPGELTVLAVRPSIGKSALA